MGLEFQARAFLHIHEADRFVPNPVWAVTGRRRDFHHFCQEAKWSSFDGARAAYKQLPSLKHSFGFFSIQEDYLDLAERTRAYVLDRGRFHEIDTRSVWSNEGGEDGLCQHFAWCRECMWPGMELQFPEASKPIELESFASRKADIVGWFFIAKKDTHFPSLMELFPRQEVAAIAQSSVAEDHYLFVGESGVSLGDVFHSIIGASNRHPHGKGLMFLPEGRSIGQVAIADGQARLLLPLKLDELPLHEDVKFDTGDFGYDAR